MWSIEIRNQHCAIQALQNVQIVDSDGVLVWSSMLHWILARFLIPMHHTHAEPKRHIKQFDMLSWLPVKVCSRPSIWHMCCSYLLEEVNATHVSFAGTLYTFIVSQNSTSNYTIDSKQCSQASVERSLIFSILDNYSVLHALIYDIYFVNYEKWWFVYKCWHTIHSTKHWWLIR